MPGKKSATSYILDDNGRRLVEENLRLVPYCIAKRFGSAAARNEDIISMGNVGLCQAAATYNPDSGTKFSTYAYHCIINRIHAYSRHKYTMSGGNGAIECTTLNAPMPTDYDQVEEYIDYIPDPRHNTEREALDHIFMDTFAPFVPTWKELTDNQYRLRELAAKRHISKQRVDQIINRELRVVRDQLIKAGYAP